MLLKDEGPRFEDPASVLSALSYGECQV